ncbi:tyrosine-protein phosphatase [Lactobacillus crispatus]|uniref:Tyrosine-protein phosphatase n=1 Tax=Lactobacillus crispatus TaxID=47770 RepID=A0AAW8WLQ4_9LACO|nr:CpsB/CapC family capsule biosynthesis tyrosine phosphatase [Lactobacillus crispatus]MDK6665462.1 exopolysaccharide biosynthesis protein [Lactobacillus crispatus]MDK8612245.1 exopolysaccharide biosynthesis protein [Lactobacillus crispatus]MDT9609557.1 CpsB/CapC family capsule biosynthesis tyrosine phosphatase [Lactobacillus crispatus]MDT9617240.1 CpsB/CapC family capsule biosynthesis tyrosine phosphatase [Lactobacillus crispatus]
MVLVDIHCHILPGIDDGSKDWDTSIKLAKAAVKDGVTHAICTPHTLNGRYTNHKDDIIWLTDLYQKKLDEAKVPLTVFPGQEVRLSGDLIDALDQDDILFCDEDGTYMLLEFPSDDVPTYAQDTIFKVMQRGITPIIVHPERNKKILEEPTVLQELIEQGCLVQITASSYMGTFGKKIEEISRKFIEAGQCACFASDAHDLPKRQYQYSEALKKLSKEFGSDLAQQYQDNARAFVNGDNVQLDWRPLGKKKKFWLF